MIDGYTRDYVDRTVYIISGVDGRTPHDGTDGACITSRGKNRNVTLTRLVDTWIHAIFLRASSTKPLRVYRQRDVTSNTYWLYPHN